MIDFERPMPKSRGGLGIGGFSILFLLLVVVVVIGMAAMTSGDSRTIVGGLAPDFTLTTFEGEQTRLSDYAGKVVVLNFWGSWCAPCRTEAPELAIAWNTYRGRDDIVFIGVAIEDIDSASQAFITDYGLDYINGADQSGISDLYYLRGVPQTVIIGKDRKIASTFFLPPFYASEHHAGD